MNIFTGFYFDEHNLGELTSEMVETVESKLKVELPSEYLAVLKQQNGGELALKKLVVNHNEDGFIVVDYLNGIGKRSGEGILPDTYTKREWGLKRKCVYLYGESHEWIALDYRKYEGNNPPVVLFDLDLEEEFILAEDFKSFIQNLSRLEDSEDISIEVEAAGYFEVEEVIPREELEKVIAKNMDQDIFTPTQGVIYYLYHDDDLTWICNQLLKETTHEKGCYEQKISSYLESIIFVLKKRDISLEQYPQLKEFLKYAIKYPSKEIEFDVDNAISNKASKILNYLECKINENF